jgi:hypothetical protein
MQPKIDFLIGSARAPTRDAHIETVDKPDKLDLGAQK